jgi:hypothetical protein
MHLHRKRDSDWRYSSLNRNKKELSIFLRQNTIVGTSREINLSRYYIHTLVHTYGIRRLAAAIRRILVNPNLWVLGHYILGLAITPTNINPTSQLSLFGHNPMDINPTSQLSLFGHNPMDINTTDTASYLTLDMCKVRSVLLPVIIDRGHDVIFRTNPLRFPFGKRAARQIAVGLMLVGVSFYDAMLANGNTLT